MRRAVNMTDSEWIESLQERIEELEEKRWESHRTLERAAHRLAEIGLIDSSPYAKRLFVDGEREL